MTKARDIANLVDSNGDVVSGALDNVPASDNASALTTGTLPDGRFPATLPASSGANLTALPAANLTGTLPALNGSSLTSLSAANLTGSLPAGMGGKLLQMQMVNGTATQTSSSSWSDVATVNITPTASGNKFIILSSGTIYVDRGADQLLGEARLRITAPSDSTLTPNNNAGTGLHNRYTNFYNDSAKAGMQAGWLHNHIYTTSSTSQHTFVLQIHDQNNGGNNSRTRMTVPSIIIMEVA